MNLGTIHIQCSSGQKNALCMAKYGICHLRNSGLLDLYLFGSIFQVSSIIDSLEVVFNKGEMHSAVVDYEALNVIIRYESGCYAN